LTPSPADTKPRKYTSDKALPKTGSAGGITSSKANGLNHAMRHSWQLVTGNYEL
jgi:hypothetical protein